MKPWSILLLIACAASSAGGEELRSPSGLSSARIALSLIPSTPVLPGLPVMVEVAINNPTDHDLVLPLPTLSTRDNPYHTLRILYAYNDARDPAEIRFVLPNHGPWIDGAPPPRPKTLTLAPNARWTLAAPISFDWTTIQPAQLIARPGRLQLWVQLCAIRKDTRNAWVVDHETVNTSNMLTVEVPTPVGDDAAVLKEVSRLKEPWILSAPEAGKWVEDEPLLVRLEQLAAGHPRSAYALYAKAVLAEMYVAGNQINLQARPHDPMTAKRWLDEVDGDLRYGLRDEMDRVRAVIRSHQPDADSR